MTIRRGKFSPVIIIAMENSHWCDGVIRRGTIVPGNGYGDKSTEKRLLDQYTKIVHGYLIPK